MLVLTRKAQESIRIGGSITVTILRVKGNSVRVGIQAPDNVRIVRSELPDFESPEVSSIVGDGNHDSIAQNGAAITSDLTIVEEEIELPTMTGELHSATGASRLRRYMPQHVKPSEIMTSAEITMFPSDAPTLPPR